MEMKEAMLYQKLPEDNVQCHVCSHRCVIRDGRRGICGVRENRKGTLYVLNDGKTIAAGIDPIEKKPLYHFLPGTLIYSFASAGCNFRCAWCQNFEIAQGPKPYEPVEGVEVLPREHVERALENGCPAIAYTYSEPTIFLEYALATMKLAHAKGLKNVWVTNGFMTRETLEVILPYLDAANVDFKGPDDGMYEKYCGGSARPVMENLRYLVENGVHVEVTTLLVPGINDKADQIEEVARFIAEELGQDIPWHISRFFPAWKLMDTPVTPLKTLMLAKGIGEKAHLTRIHLGNV
jgi:pyruvate formate lyase activating enzyme